MATPTTDPAPHRSRPGPGPRPLGPLEARLWNLPGLVSPLANLALLRLGSAETRWMGPGAGVVCWLAAGWGLYRDLPWLLGGALGLHLALVLLGLIAPRLPEVPFRAWIAFGRVLGDLVAIPIFSLVYFVVVTPLALVMRALGKDPLRRRAPPQESYWVRREPRPREHFERQF